ncbi:MAG: diacylglycerol kinase family protein [Thomasclavelia sp.]|nr:diacylglycerol kinase family protein [Thomasclavelia sp.]
MKHIFIAKKGYDGDLLNSIVSIMQGYDYKIVYTSKIEDAKQIASEYNHLQEPVRIYSIGGDGMAYWTVNGMVGSNNELVILPRGTGNDTARALYDTLDPIQILKSTLKQEAKTSTLMQINEHYSINVICCGLDAEIANSVHDNNSGFKGKYIFTLLNKIKNLTLYPTIIKSNNEVIYKGKCAVCAICNGKYFGGGFMIGYHSSFNSSTLDINIVDNIKKKDLLKCLKALVTKKIPSLPQYKTFNLNEIEITSTQRFNVDGEIFEPGTYKIKKIENIINIVY